MEQVGAGGQLLIVNTVVMWRWLLWLIMLSNLSKGIRVIRARKLNHGWMGGDGDKINWRRWRDIGVVAFVIEGVGSLPERLGSIFLSFEWLMYYVYENGLPTLIMLSELCKKKVYWEMNSEISYREMHC